MEGEPPEQEMIGCSNGRRDSKWWLGMGEAAGSFMQTKGREVD